MNLCTVRQNPIHRTVITAAHDCAQLHARNTSDNLPSYLQSRQPS